MKKSETTSMILLDNLDASKLPELQGLKDKQLLLVEECPYVEITDNSAYEVAKKHRTALLKGRTSLESQDKLIASKLTAFRKSVSEVTKGLIDITLPHETKQEEEVKRYEQIKENERLERERLENERIDKIKKAIDNIESDCYSVIQSMTFETIEKDKKSIDLILESDIDFMEFDYTFDLAKQRLLSQFDSKKDDLTTRENDRLERERLQKEKEESDAKLKAIEDKQEKERLERDQKERYQKEKVFEVRKNRLAEIGVDLHNNTFMHVDSNPLQKEVVYNADFIDFENILVDFKLQIQNAKDKLEKQKAEKEAIEKAEIERKKKAEKENKSRTKRLANDKKIISESLEVYFADLHLETENQETKDFIQNANIQIQQLKSILLTQLKNL